MAQSAMQDEQRRKGTLVNGHVFTLSPAELVVTDGSGRIVTQTPLDEMTLVQRGGTDVMIMCGQHDPVSLGFIRLDEATTFEQSLNALLSSTRETRPQHASWKFWKR